MKRLIGLLFMGLLLNTQAQQNENQALKDAIKTFNDSDDISGMLESTILFKKASALDPDNWMNSYWTAFAYSQCGRLTETPLAYYDTAQMYFDKAKAKLSTLNEVQQSDVYALESLISSLKSAPYWAKGDRQMGMKLSQIENTSLSKALALNNNNPRVYLLTGTSLISDGRRTQNDGYIVAGRNMLEIAREKYDANKSTNPLYPDWGSGWVNFWLANSQLSGD